MKDKIRSQKSEVTRNEGLVSDEQKQNQNNLWLKTVFAFFVRFAVSAFVRFVD